MFPARPKSIHAARSMTSGPRVAPSAGRLLRSPGSSPEAGPRSRSVLATGLAWASFVHVIHCAYSAAPRQRRKGIPSVPRFTRVGFVAIHQAGSETSPLRRLKERCTERWSQGRTSLSAWSVGEPKPMRLPPSDCAHRRIRIYSRPSHRAPDFQLVTPSDSSFRRAHGRTGFSNLTNRLRKPVLFALSRRGECSPVRIAFLRLNSGGSWGERVGRRN